MQYKDSSIEKYLNDLAARLPAPGGGSAAALTAAMGAALVSMVINFTLGKPRYERYEKELKKMLDASEKLHKKFLELVDLDAQAYKSKNLNDALNIPFMVARLSFEGIKLCPPLINKGNVNLISDVAVAAAFLESAFVSAKFNVEINLKGFKSEKFSDKVSKELDEKEKRIKRLRRLVEEKVGKIIRG